MVSSSSSSLSTSGKRKSSTNANKKKIKNIATCSAIVNTATTTTTTPTTNTAASKTSLKLGEKSKRISTGSNVKKKKAVKKHKAIKISAMTVASIAATQIVVNANEKENEIQEEVHKKSPPPPTTNKTKLKKSNKPTAKRFTPLPPPLPKLPTPTDTTHSPSKFYAHDQTKLNELSSLNARLDDLNVQLAQLRSPHSTAQFNHHHPELGQYLNEMCELESESDANLLKLKFFYDKQVIDVERQCESEMSKARQEFNEKRNELKETLRLEQEEARRKCSEIADLSIHYDEAFICSSNAKRKLRRRCNNVNLNIDHLLESPEYGQFFK